MVNELKKPGLSIIIPAYNAGPCIGRTLDSIICSDFNFEVIIIDDGSTDDTYSIINRYQKEDLRIKIFRQDNRGVSSARNKGLSIAQAEYVAFVDADDTLTKDYFYEIESVLDKNYDLIVFGFNLISQESVQKHFENEIGSGNINTNLRKSLKTPGFWNRIWNKIYKKNKIYKYFDINLSLGEDLRFNCEYLTGINSVCTIEKCLYNYHFDGGVLSKFSSRYETALLNDTATLLKVLNYFNFENSIISDDYFYRFEKIVFNACSYKTCREMLLCLTSDSRFNYYSDIMLPEKPHHKIVRYFLLKNDIFFIYCFIKIIGLVRKYN